MKEADRNLLQTITVLLRTYISEIEQNNGPKMQWLAEEITDIASKMEEKPKEIEDLSSALSSAWDAFKEGEGEKAKEIIQRKLEELTKLL